MIVRGEPSATPNVTYRIYYGVDGLTGCVSTIQIASNVVGNLVRGISYRFVATAVDSNGVESVQSNQLSCQAPSKPNP